VLKRTVIDLPETGRCTQTQGGGHFGSHTLVDKKYWAVLTLQSPDTAMSVRDRRQK